MFSDYVILPLYSNIRGVKVVPEKSGINQWNAGGRRRKFGESYIPVPQAIHKTFPDFFPAPKNSFILLLPNGISVEASLCQSGGKALMSNPNHILCDWLFRLIDQDYGTDAWMVRLTKSIPYTYDDLETVGMDSVKITKNKNSIYEIELMPIGSYEALLDLN